MLLRQRFPDMQLVRQSQWLILTFTAFVDGQYRNVDMAGLVISD